MTEWDSNKTMRKLARLRVANERECEEITDLIKAIPHMKYANIFENPNIETLFMLLQYAYALGIDSGKRQERQTARQKARVLA